MCKVAASPNYKIHYLQFNNSDLLVPEYLPIHHKTSTSMHHDIGIWAFMLEPMDNHCIVYNCNRADWDGLHDYLGWIYKGSVYK